MHYAAYHGKSDCAWKLILAGADLNLRACNNKYRTPLHVAAFMGHTDIVRMLVVKRARIDLLDADGKTASQLAREQLTVVQLGIRPVFLDIIERIEQTGKKRS